MWGLGRWVLEAATGGAPAAGDKPLGSAPTGLWMGFRQHLSAFHSVFIVVTTPSMRSTLLAHCVHTVVFLTRESVVKRISRT